jgi:hypothetical protein
MQKTPARVAQAEKYRKDLTPFRKNRSEEAREETGGAMVATGWEPSIPGRRIDVSARS